MILSSLEEGVMLLRLARPERRNALDRSLVREGRPPSFTGR